MKLTLVFLGLCALVVSTPVEQTGQDQDVAMKQKHVMQMLRHINQHSHIKEHQEIANSYDIKHNADHYTKPEVVTNFMQYYRNGMLPRNHIFSIFYQDHMKQAMALFRMFYYAKDYDTFYRTAVWARQHVNEGMFLYTYSVAIVHRPDTQGVVLPPIYEIYPHYFFNTEVMNMASIHKQMHHGQQREQEHNAYNGYTIMANYTGHRMNVHPEQSMSYFMEDVGINAFYYYYNIYYPFWMDGTEYGLANDNRGEQFYYMHQQILARYYMERLANGFGEIPFINWDIPVETPYYPSMQYPNGIEFPARPKFANLHEYFYNYGQSWSMKGPYGYSYTLVRDFERRINDAIDRGYVQKPDGTKVDIYTEGGMNTLGNIIESNPDSPNRKYYGAMWMFARHLLGYSTQPMDRNHVVPSAMEHFETSMRDPMFYQLYKKIVLKFQRYKMNIPPYTEKDMIFPGVKIINVEFDRLITYFDKFYSDISNGVFYNPDESTHENFHVRAMQYRLNHKPFSYKVTVKSDKDTKAIVKIFMGPKYDEYHRFINITENRMNMVQFDHFVYDLKNGENVITRHSNENYFYGPERTSYAEMYKQIMAGKQANFDARESYFYFPQRYMLPKGTTGGTTYQFYVIVAPYVPYHGHQQGQQQQQHRTQHGHPMVGTGGQYVDGYPMGWPFDRNIEFEQFWYHIPNSYFYETKIYQRHETDVGDVHHHQTHHEEQH